MVQLLLSMFCKCECNLVYYDTRLASGSFKQFINLIVLVGGIHNTNSKRKYITLDHFQAIETLEEGFDCDCCKREDLPEHVQMWICR